MYESQYFLVAALGSVSLLFTIGLYRWHSEVELFGAISLFCWSILILASSNLVVVDGGQEFSYGSFSVQLLSLGLAIISLLAIFGSLTGKWPPGEESDREAPV